MKTINHFTGRIRDLFKKDSHVKPQRNTATKQDKQHDKPNIDRHNFRPHHIIMMVLGLAMLFACSLDEDPIGSGSSDVDLLINEVSTKGDDWVELYNPQNAALDITGFRAYDQGHADEPYIFPDAQIPANGYLVLYCNNEGQLYNASFGLSADGETVAIAEANGAVIEMIDVPALNDGESYARVPDGSDNWVVIDTPSPGMPNSGETETDLYINEIVSYSDPDWLEIYNPGNQPRDISGYYLYDGGSVSEKSVFPSGTIVPAGGFLVWDCDDVQTNFKLSSAGEDVYLEDETESLLDSVTFQALNQGESYARVPDGGDWQITQNPTPGESNIE